MLKRIARAEERPWYTRIKFYKLRYKIWRVISLKNRRRARRDRINYQRAMNELAKFPKHARAPLHALPGELVISLTSYAARFPTLHLTLKSLLDQSVRPNRIVLWMAHDDVGRLPEEVRALAGETLEIRETEDLRNFKKILPSLKAFPGAFILICDDDSYYPDNWLERTVAAYDPQEPTIVCNRAHKVAYTPSGEVAPYRSWKRNWAHSSTATARTDILPTGNGGVLYPPGSLPPETNDLELIRQLSATSDDVWLYFMWRKAGWRAKRVPGPKREFLEWPDSQGQALWAFHRGGKKDEHIRDMARHFGNP